MRLIILSIFSLFLAFCLNAQITVTSDYFPEAGDTLKTVFDAMPLNIVINPSGGSTDQNWDFTSLQGMPRETIYRNASEGENFADYPNADLMIDLAPAGESYYRVTPNSFEFLGYVGLDPANLGINILVRLEPPLIERSAPLNFIDFSTSSVLLSLPFGANDIPGGLLDSLPFPFPPDSIRLRVDIDRASVVDGWGTLAIPGDSYEVLREKRIEETQTFLDVKFGFGDWVEIPNIGLDFLGRDTTTTYSFYSNDAKEAIAIVTVDNEDNDIVNFVEYKDNDVPTSIRYVDTGRPDILAYPNPAIDDVMLEFFNLPPSYYTIKIYNILGVVTWEKKYYISGNRTEKISLNHLRKGTYLYSLVNENGKTISTKRLMVMRP